LPATQIDAVARRAVRFVKAFAPGDDRGVGQWPLLLRKIWPASLGLAATSALRSATASSLGLRLRLALRSSRLRLRERRSRHDKHRDR
jgi:hypothetical protein